MENFSFCEVVVPSENTKSELNRTGKVKFKMGTGQNWVHKDCIKKGLRTRQKQPFADALQSRCC